MSKGGNQNLLIKEGQTIQWPKKKYKRTNNDLQNTTQKNKEISNTNSIKNRV